MAAGTAALGCAYVGGPVSQQPTLKLHPDEQPETTELIGSDRPLAVGQYGCLRAFDRIPGIVLCVFEKLLRRHPVQLSARRRPDYGSRNAV